MSIPSGKRPTIKDVAKAAGVSRSTTSRALTGKGYVAAAVADRVRAAAAGLGYVPDASARSLKQQRSRILGIVVSDLRNHFYADLVAGASAEARQAGYFVMTCDTSGEPDGDRSAAEAFVALRVDGVVSTPVNAELGHLLERNGVPLVEVDRTFSDGALDSVTVANRSATRRLVDHLLDLGHTRIALLVDEPGWTTGRERHAGYAEALAARGVAADPSLVLGTGWDAEGARATTAALLARPDRPTAVLAANNVLAQGAWRAVQEAGLAVPGDVSLASFDDSPWMSMVSPGITCVAQDSAESGRVAVRVLLARIADPHAPVSATELACRLVLRGSTGPAARRRPADPRRPPRSGRTAAATPSG